MRRLFLLLLLVGCGSDGDKAAGVVFINEVMPSNTAACPDPFGEYDDWVELYNSSNDDIDLTGYKLSDDPTLPGKATLDEIVVPAHGYKLLWLDDQVQGLDHFLFKLDAKGEQIGLYTADLAPIDETTFGEATTDVSFARVPDGTGEFVSCTTSTCGASNACAGAR